jgi:hypothetical protein
MVQSSHRTAALLSKDLQEDAELEEFDADTHEAIEMYASRRQSNLEQLIHDNELDAEQRAWNEAMDVFDNTLVARMRKGHTAAELAAIRKATANFDCADEVILRAAMSKALEAPPSELQECVDSRRQQAMEKEYVKDSKGAEPEWTELATVESMYSICQQSHGHRVSIGPRLVRMTGHDAADYRNTMYANGSAPTADDGGVDTCLHSNLASQGLHTYQDEERIGEAGDEELEAEEEEGAIEGDPNHNRGLGNAVAFVLAFADASKLSRPDIEVLGATMYLEAWSQSGEVGYRLGRERGVCVQPICLDESCWNADTQFFKAAAGTPVGAGNFCPYTNGVRPLQNVLGLEVDEFVALQGAHSIGGVMMCGGMGDVSSGFFCPNKCDFPKTLGAMEGQDIFGLGFGGTSFDDTPGKLDNRYYQLLAKETYANLPDCEELVDDFAYIHRGGSAGGGKKISAGRYSTECTTKDPEKDTYYMCKDRAMPQRGVFARDPSVLESCAAGVAFVDESQCDVGDCAENCQAGADCQDAMDVEGLDVGALKKAFVKCNACKMKCMKKNRNDPKLCAASCPERMAEACPDVLVCMDPWEDWKTFIKCAKKEVPKKCWKAAINANKACKAECTALENIPPPPKREVNWCKALPAVAACMDPRYTTGSRQGPHSCGECPKELCIRVPNIGGGRSAQIKSTNRWSSYRGIVKRVMVLPTDWSYLADAELKSHFVAYADDEALFKKKFAIAWKKITEKGKESVLKNCNAVTCTASADGISCPVQAEGYSGHQQLTHSAKAGEMANSMEPAPGSGGSGSAAPKPGKRVEFERPENLVFTACDSDARPTSGECQLVGGYGLRGKFDCGGWTGVCATEYAVQLEANIAAEWEQGGGVEPTCGL